MLKNQSKSYAEWYKENVKDKRGDNQYSHRFFANKDCEFWRCHSDIPEKKFSCLFCYCPLLAQENCLGIQNGDGKYLENGWKDCSQCSWPHNPDNYDLMMEEIANFHDERN